MPGSHKYFAKTVKLVSNVYQNVVNATEKKTQAARQDSAVRVRPLAERQGSAAVLEAELNAAFNTPRCICEDGPPFQVHAHHELYKPRAQAYIALLFICSEVTSF